MSRTVIVVSALVDATIRDGQPDTTFILKHNLQELAQHIETTPIRADYFYFTQDVIPHTNTSLNFIVQMLDNPFLKVDKVCYITEKGAREIASINYIVAEKGYTNWEVIEGYLTREYVAGIISGAMRSDSFNKKRKALYRVPREAYIRDRLKNKDALEEEYTDDEKLLKDVPAVDVPTPTIFDSDEIGRIIHIAGLDTNERTALSFVVAQYLAMEGKTLIVEKDSDYHRLTEYCTKSGVQCKQITVDQFCDDPGKAIADIRTCKERLIVITAVRRVHYNYAFLCNVLYANLADSLSYFIREDDLNEAPALQSYIVAVPSTVLGILQTCEAIDAIDMGYIRWVGVNLQALPETVILNTKTFATIISDILENKVQTASIVTINSLRIGGEVSYDIRSILGI